MWEWILAAQGVVALLQIWNIVLTYKARKKAPKTSGGRIKA